MRKYEDKDSFKFPVYWSEFIEPLSDKQAGKLLKIILKYAFYGEYPDIDIFTEEQRKAFAIMKRDIDFQEKYPREYRFHEDFDDATIVRRSGAYSNWRKAVFERDGYMCQSCGQLGGRLNAHHIKRFADYPELRLVVDNGITLCESCHRKVHRHEIHVILLEE